MADGGRVNRHAIPMVRASSSYCLSLCDTPAANHLTKKRAGHAMFAHKPHGAQDTSAQGRWCTGRTRGEERHHTTTIAHACDGVPRQTRRGGLSSPSAQRLERCPPETGSSRNIHNLMPRLSCPLVSQRGELEAGRIWAWGSMWSPAAALKAVLVAVLVFHRRIHVAPSGTDKHLGGMQEYQRGTPRTKAVLVDKGRHCNQPVLCDHAARHCSWYRRDMAGSANEVCPRDPRISATLHPSIGSAAASQPWLAGKHAGVVASHPSDEPAHRSDVT